MLKQSAQMAPVASTPSTPPGDVPGGPGWVIDGQTLLPRITEPAVFREGLAHDPLVDAVEALWSGDPQRARTVLQRECRTVRVRAMLADCDRDLGRVERAIDEYEDLLAECADTPWEPVLRQHYGKTLLAAGRAEDALEEFEAAYEMRVEAGAAPDLIASSEQARARAEQLVSAQIG